VFEVGDFVAIAHGSPSLIWEMHENRTATVLRVNRHSTGMSHSADDVIAIRWHDNDLEDAFYARTLQKVGTKYKPKREKGGFSKWIVNSGSVI
jgi:hypothetical protein